MSIIFIDVDSVKYNNVSFSYDNDRQVLKDFFLNAYKTNIILIKGKNGIGKTTALNLLLGIWKDYYGDIFINEVNIRKFNRETLLDNVAICFQKTAIFNDSIKNNIIFDQNYDEYILNKLIEKINLDGLVSELKNGINTNINETKKLSGGQFQKIGILRTLYTRKPIMIFDEPTSSLDKESIDAFVNLIEEYKNDRIIFIVTHDDTLVKIADNVYDFIN